ncbi:S8 family peptidase [Actinomadura madurae]|uniref:S8 family peptidase n=1 Tax=Actinomadura madurae TaxID=1993 RepID=UPI002026FF94|nr:S8 family peptidase [Actinomadura madurae]MCP9951889.1 S8 family peptidase [Actinomadura madurae]MCP9968659.1 S8 family peptidase [Actinomadura madurae]MCP9981134.1 S8 family peptidase [Actinomadura madurae]URM97064.1 S8 family peptidase [Actinomadura madurae]URN07843.1 S8 family peptidase [Actinomadura madurae]
MRAVHRRLLLVGTVATCLGAAATFPVLADDSASLVRVTAAEGTPVPGQYIVTLKSGASPDAAAKKVRAAGVKRFDGVLNGFAARLNQDQLAKLRRDGRVAAIEQDQVVSASTTQRAPLPWGLDRIDQRSAKLSKSYYYKSSGSGVNAYVIDTGLDVGHKDFGGRASVAWAASRFGGDGRDCNGHGTHVAGIIGAKTYGAAKSVKLRALRVLDCKGEGSMSDVVAAVNWLRTHAAKPAVANLSLGGPKSAALNTAVMNLSKSGVFVSVAAGNDNADACKFSPSGAGWVMTVGATTKYDNRAAFSNWGKCVDINAPGYGIYSTWPGGGHKGLSGTSMAAPYVSGVAALYLSTHKKATFPQVQKWLNDNSTHTLKRLKQQANRLVYKGKL